MPSSKLNFSLLTIFPEMFPGPLAHSLAGKGLDKNIWSYQTINIRDFASDKHQSVDDAPFGGGTGMVMRPDVLGNAIENSIKPGTKIIYPSPRGKLFTQDYAQTLAKEENIAIICGRFEGIDERVITSYNIEEVSIGDYILSGGEIAALVIMDACIRLIPGIISKETALDEESFGNNNDYAGLLEYPLYTRPSDWQGNKVPEVLLSGNHEQIKTWRKLEAIRITKERRQDLWLNYLKGKDHD